MKSSTSFIQKRKQKSTVHYVDNKAFLDAIIAHHEKVKVAKKLKKEEPRLSDYIGTCLLKIAEKLRTSPSFIKYSFGDRLISDAVAGCILYFNNFDPTFNKGKTEYPNPFAYFTQICRWSFVRTIYEEERDRYGKYKVFQEQIIHAYDRELWEEGVTPDLYDNINAFMAEFERKEAAKKERKKAKAGMLTMFMEDEVVGTD